MGPDFLDIFFIIKCSKRVLTFVLYTILSLFLLVLRKVFRVFGSGYLMFKGNDVTQNYYFHCPPPGGAESGELGRGHSAGPHQPGKHPPNTDIFF